MRNIVIRMNRIPGFPHFFKVLQSTAEYFVATHPDFHLEDRKKAVDNCIAYGFEAGRKSEKKRNKWWWVFILIVSIVWQFIPILLKLFSIWK